PAFLRGETRAHLRRWLQRSTTQNQEQPLTRDIVPDKGRHPPEEAPKMENARAFLPRCERKSETPEPFPQTFPHRSDCLLRPRKAKDRAAAAGWISGRSSTIPNRLHADAF